MEDVFLTDRISSIAGYSKSLEFVLPGSSISCKSQSERFASEGQGLLSQGFFLGQNLTMHCPELEIRDLGSIIFSMPLTGTYQTKISNKHFKTCTPETGVIFLPSDSIQYQTGEDYANELLLVLDFQQIGPLLERNYGIIEIHMGGFEAEFGNEKVESLVNYIHSNIQVLRLFPHFRDSIHYKTSIIEVTKLLFADLIADSLHKPFKLPEFSDSSIVKKAEELMDAFPEKYFSVQEIADRVATSPRNLQLCFKKHREYTPMQFLRERKLYKARSYLCNPDPHQLIKNVAYDSGFSNLSSFRRNYRELFGELPAETLKRAQGSGINHALA